MAEGRVLVVDDEADVRRTIRLTLTKAGFDVVEAEDGQAGIDAIRSGDNPLAVDTIICDMKMPNVNGMGAIAYFRQQFPSVPVIVLTGNPDFNDVNELFKQGIVEYLTKPIESEKLVEAVKKAAHSHELFKDQFST
jgi:two-component system chemotaxis response regulator CheY